MSAGQTSSGSSPDGALLGVDVGGKVTMDLEAGDTVTVETPGGGGFGRE